MRSFRTESRTSTSTNEISLAGSVSHCDCTFARCDIFAIYIHKTTPIFCTGITKGGVAGANHAHHWNSRKEDWVVGYFTFGHAPCHAHRIRINFREISPFCSLMQSAENLHKYQYKAYVLLVLVVEMSKSELHTPLMRVGAPSS